MSALLRDDDALKACEASFPDGIRLNWIGKIRQNFACDKLVAIRAKALTLELPNLAQLITATLKRIEPNELARIIRKQMSTAPPTWRRSQQMQADEYEREARITQARSTPFEKIIAKLKGSTSMIALKVWCEGPTDRPIFRALLRELGQFRIADTLDFVGGWSQLLSEHEPDRWLDGCHHAVIIMDGDNGRKLGNSKRPEKQEVKDLRNRFAGKAIQLFVLRRFGIENYFPQSAFERVLSRDLSSYFPLPETSGVKSHLVDRVSLQPLFAKKLHNEAIAEQITFADIAGTDLQEIVQAVVAEAQNIQTN